MTVIQGTLPLARILSVQVVEDGEDTLSWDSENGSV